MFFVVSQAWDKEKILSLHEESPRETSDLQIAHSDALTLGHRLRSERGLLTSSYDMHPAYG